MCVTSLQSVVLSVVDAIVQFVDFAVYNFESEIVGMLTRQKMLVCFTLSRRAGGKWRDNAYSIASNFRHTTPI